MRRADEDASGEPRDRVRGATIARRMRESLAVDRAVHVARLGRCDRALVALRARIKAGSPDLADVNDQRPGHLLHDPGAADDAGSQCRIRRRPRSSRMRTCISAFASIRPEDCSLPVVRDAQRLSIVDAGSTHESAEPQSRRGNDRARRSVAARRSPISNLGALGIESFTPLINPPQVAILGVDAIQLEAGARETAASSSSMSIGLSLTCDHQVIDGAPGARSPDSLREDRASGIG